MSTDIKVIKRDIFVTRSHVCYEHSGKTERGFLVEHYLGEIRIYSHVESLNGDIITLPNIVACPLPIVELKQEIDTVVLLNSQTKEIVYGAISKDSDGISVDYFNLDGSLYLADPNVLILTYNYYYSSPLLFCIDGETQIFRTDIIESSGIMVLASIWTDTLGKITSAPSNESSLVPGSCNLPLDIETSTVFDNEVINFDPTGRFIQLLQVCLYQREQSAIESHAIASRLIEFYTGAPYSPRGVLTIDKPLIPNVTAHSLTISNGQSWTSPPITKSIALSIKKASSQNPVKVTGSDSTNVLLNKLRCHLSWDVEGSSVLEEMQVQAVNASEAHLVWTTQPLLEQVLSFRNPLTSTEQQMANVAWKYFLNNVQRATGLVSSSDYFPSATAWDMASQLGGMVAAVELGLLSVSNFDSWMSQSLTSIRDLPLYNNELPNKVYNTTNLNPTNYGSLSPSQFIGWSALDIGRLCHWLWIIAKKYAQHRMAVRDIVSRWNPTRLISNGFLYGTSKDTTSTSIPRETYNLEGRHGYLQYAAQGLKKFGFIAPNALDNYANLKYTTIYGVDIPSDMRETYFNYVTSEPYILDGIETGFKSLGQDFAQRIIRTQMNRYRQTGIPTIWSEDSLNVSPYFAYNCIFCMSNNWITLDSSGNNASQFRGNSTKASVAWKYLFPSGEIGQYTQFMSELMGGLFNPNRGYYAGTYEVAFNGMNTALTLNTNGIILEALLYRYLGQPIGDWAEI
jgi:hypothetical protein